MLDLRKKLEEVSGVRVDDQKIVTDKHRTIKSSPTDTPERAKVLPGVVYTLLFNPNLN